MKTIGHFQVEPRIVQVLGSHYRSSEEALLELVANSWDADATRVEITLPTALTGQPLTISDNGYGMTPHELEARYLHVGFDRRNLEGLSTPKNRKVKGQLGVGKFAGFAIAEQMTLTTTSRGRRSRLVLDRLDLLGRTSDLESVDVPFEVEDSAEPSGTRVELLHLRQLFSHPSPKKLGTMLLREFGVPDDFTILIDGMPVTRDVLEGRKVQFELALPEQPQVSGAVWIMPNTRSIPDPGIAIRVDGRLVGPPSYLGLEDDPEIPLSVLQRLTGELQADGLSEAVTASQAAIIENSEPYRAFQDAARAQLKAVALELRAEEAPEPEQAVQRYERQLELLPLVKQEHARAALLRLFQRFYGVARDRQDAIANVVIGAFEEDEYWIVVKRLDEVEPGNLSQLADVLQEWGLNEVADVVARARSRLKVLDAFEELAGNLQTPELSGVHRALEANPWLVSDEYELWKSNRTLRRIVGDATGKIVSKSHGARRPDLILVGLQERYLLIELKRPSDEINRDDIAQAEGYRDVVQQELRNGAFRILVVGGRVEKNMPKDDRREVRVTSYMELVTLARERLDWLLANLSEESERPATPVAS